MNDLVDIWHPQHPGVTSRIPRAAFERRSSKLGWRLVEEQVPDQVVDEPPGDEKAALTATLEAAGVAVDGRWGLKRLRVEAANLGTDEDFDE